MDKAAKTCSFGGSGKGPGQSPKAGVPRLLLPQWRRATGGPCETSLAVRPSVPCVRARTHMVRLRAQTTGHEPLNEDSVRKDVPIHLSVT